MEYNLGLNTHLNALCISSADEIDSADVAYKCGMLDWESGKPDARKPYGGDLQKHYERGLNDSAKASPANS